MIREDLWARAGVLATRVYKVEFEWDELLDGSSVVVAINPELPGCLAQGMTVEEALEELKEARQVYIYSLLEDGLPVPEPEITAGSVSRNLDALTHLSMWSPKRGNKTDIFQDTRGDYLPKMIEGSLRSPA